MQAFQEVFPNSYMENDRQRGRQTADKQWRWYSEVHAERGGEHAYTGIRLTPDEFWGLVNTENQKSVESVYNAQKITLRIDNWDSIVCHL